MKGQISKQDSYAVSQQKGSKLVLGKRTWTTAEDKRVFDHSDLFNLCNANGY